MLFECVRSRATAYLHGASGSRVTPLPPTRSALTHVDKYTHTLFTSMYCTAVIRNKDNAVMHSLVLVRQVCKAGRYHGTY